MFESADTTQTGLIDERQVVSLVKKLNTGLTTVKIQQKLKVSHRLLLCMFIRLLVNIHVLQFTYA